MKVQEIMTREVMTVGPEADLRDVARVLVDNGISGLPVCGVRRELLGIVSEGDIIVKEGGPRKERGFLGRFRRTEAKTAQKARAVTVREAMTTPVVTISPHTSVAEAARRMSDLGIKRLPVVQDDKLVGIVSRTDLVRAFVRSDDEIRREIREDLLRADALARGARGRPGPCRARRGAPERSGGDGNRCRSARAVRRSRAGRRLGLTPRSAGGSTMRTRARRELERLRLTSRKRRPPRLSRRPRRPRGRRLARIGYSGWSSPSEMA